MATAPLQLDVCRGDSTTIKCENTLNTNFTVVVNDAINGVKQSPTSKCGLT